MILGPYTDIKVPKIKNEAKEAPKEKPIPEENCSFFIPRTSSVNHAFIENVKAVVKTCGMQTSY